MAVGTPRFGLWLFPDHPAGVLADVIVAAEAAGLDEVWLGDEGPRAIRSSPWRPRPSGPAPSRWASP